MGEEERKKAAHLRESQVALSKKLEELRIQSRSTAREGLMLRHQVGEDIMIYEPNRLLRKPLVDGSGFLVFSAERSRQNQNEEKIATFVLCEFGKLTLIE